MDWIRKNTKRTAYNTIFRSRQSHQRNRDHHKINKNTNKAVSLIRILASIRPNNHDEDVQVKPFSIAIVQVYAPTSASRDDEIEEFYSLLESTLDQVKSTEVLVVTGYLNAKVGQERKGNIAGPCGMGSTGEKNERGDKLI